MYRSFGYCDPYPLCCCNVGMVLSSTNFFGCYIIATINILSYDALVLSERVLHVELSCLVLSQCVVTCWAIVPSYWARVLIYWATMLSYYVIVLIYLSHYALTMSHNADTLSCSVDILIYHALRLIQVWIYSAVVLIHGDIVLLHWFGIRLYHEDCVVAPVMLFSHSVVML